MQVAYCCCCCCDTMQITPHTARLKPSQYMVYREQWFHNRIVYIRSTAAVKSICISWLLLMWHNGLVVTNIYTDRREFHFCAHQSNQQFMARDKDSSNQIYSRAAEEEGKTHPGLIEGIPPFFLKLRMEYQHSIQHSFTPNTVVKCIPYCHHQHQ